MPRFFFHFRKPGKDLLDCDGTILADAAAARDEAASAIGGFFQRSREVVDPAWIGWSLDVCDQTGMCVCSLAFADAAKLAGRDVQSAPEQAKVVYLPAERARRQFASEAGRTRQLVERTAMLLDRSRYEFKTLTFLRKESESVSRQSCELLARSRKQSATGSSRDTRTIVSSG